MRARRALLIQIEATPLEDLLELSGGRVLGVVLGLVHVLDDDLLLLAAIPLCLFILGPLGALANLALDLLLVGELPLAPARGLAEGRRSGGRHDGLGWVVGVRRSASAPGFESKPARVLQPGRAKGGQLTINAELVKMG